MSRRWLSALNRKLLRDLLQMRGQAIAIAMVVAAGVAMFVMYLSNFDSLRLTQLDYYERHRFADVFASLKRAPMSLADRIEAIPGVMAVEPRVVAAVSLDVSGLDEPASALLIAVPEQRRPRVNDLFLRRGQWIDAHRPDEVMASEGFIIANRLSLGDQVGVVINGRYRQLTIVGVALSPEHVYNIRPGEIVPDDRRFAIFWMERRALASAFDMEGAFNDVVLRLSPGTASPAVIVALDRLLQPYGGLGAIPRQLQLSHWTLENELAQLQSFGVILPLVFLSVAAFILNVALTRALALHAARVSLSERSRELASLRVLGFTRAEISLILLGEMALLTLAALPVGGLLGYAIAAWIAQALDSEVYRFPLVVSRAAIAWAYLTVVAATLVSALIVRRRLDALDLVAVLKIRE